MRDEFMIIRQGKQYALYAGLLDEGHARGLRGIDTELVQIPTAENAHVAVVKAVVEMEGSEAEGSRTFSGIGDASPENVGRNIVPHIIRMAETRAKARALRDAVNVGALPFEELTDGSEDAATDATPATRLTPVTASSASRQGDGAKSAAKGRPAKARKSQIDLLRTLAEELRGENGVARLESRIGKSLGQLTRSEAEEWIERLTPSEGGETTG